MDRRTGGGKEGRGEKTEETGHTRGGESASRDQPPPWRRGTERAVTVRSDMERILVSMSNQCGAWGAWSRAISLARRIDAKLYALLLTPPSAKTAVSAGDNSTAGTVRKRLELLIEVAKSEGVSVDYFISEGNYEEEVIRFVEQNRITLLVAESADEDGSNSERDLAQIRRISHRIKCRMELVSPRKNQNFCKGESEGHEHSTASVSPNCRE